jgi:hypothetical protein
MLAMLDFIVVSVVVDEVLRMPDGRAADLCRLIVHPVEWVLLRHAAAAGKPVPRRAA